MINHRPHTAAWECAASNPAATFILNANTFVKNMLLLQLGMHAALNKASNALAAAMRTCGFSLAEAQAKHIVVLHFQFCQRLCVFQFCVAADKHKFHVLWILHQPKHRCMQAAAQKAVSLVLAAIGARLRRRHNGAINTCSHANIVPPAGAPCNLAFTPVRLAMSAMHCQLRAAHLIHKCTTELVVATSVLSIVSHSCVVYFQGISMHACALQQVRDLRRTPCCLKEAAAWL